MSKNLNVEITLPYFFLSFKKRMLFANKLNGLNKFGSRIIVKINWPVPINFGKKLEKMKGEKIMIVKYN